MFQLLHHDRMNYRRKAVAAATAVQANRAMAILAMPEHGQDARGTSVEPNSVGPGPKALRPYVRCGSAALRYPLLACASCSSFNVFPVASFQSTRPLEGRPNTTSEAIDGELNV